MINRSSQPGGLGPGGLGLIGLGVMGRSLAINISSHGFPLSVYNRHVDEVEENIANKFLQANPSLTQIVGFDDIADFMGSLAEPRNILLMVDAGPPVDGVIAALLPHLSPGDLIMDGGNSHFEDTVRRQAELRTRGCDFLGIGISGGEEGARKGPALMVGGDQAAYERVKPCLDAIAAKDANGLPCSACVGPEGSGHFVKMIHNGIEYAEMQIIAECYQLMRFHRGMVPDRIADVFEEWGGDAQDGSYLLEITATILRKKENDGFLIDKIRDVARNKGTGNWSVAAASQLGRTFSTTAEALGARFLSALPATRARAAELYRLVPRELPASLDVRTLRGALRASRIINHAMGFHVLSAASDANQWALDLSEIARVWTNGCIIRSRLMQALVKIFRDVPRHLLLHPDVIAELSRERENFTEVVAAGLRSGCALPVMSAALNYFNGIASGQSPANLIQAQRDFFGAHTYQRIDRPDDESFHTTWT